MRWACPETSSRGFARALAHVLSGLRQLKRNQTAKIATARGLAHTLCRPGISNHAVQLVEMDLARLDDVGAVAAAAVKALKPFFSNSVDVFYAARPAGETLLTWDKVLETMATSGGVVVAMTAYAHSGIDGKSFKVTLSAAAGGAARRLRRRW